MVNPRHELPSVTGTAAEAAAYQAEERVEHASSVRTQCHCRSKRNLPSSIHTCFFEGALPRSCDVNAESPGVWCVGFMATENARVLVVRMVVPVRINRRRACLQPHPWLARRRRDRLSNDTCRQHTRLHDLVSIGFRVTAVDAAAGQIDHDVAAVNLTLPVAEGRAIPRDDSP